MARLMPLLLLALRAEGSCFGRDASFSRGGKPTVRQPSSREPGKVMVDWSKIVQNERCVDKFVVWMWPDGTERTGINTVKVEVAKTIKSNIMDVQACIGYRFAVELDEKEMTGNKKVSGDTLFKTTGVPTVGRLDASSFTVGYHWDPVRKVSDLRLASVSFPRSLVQHASCLDYIQVTGEAVRAGRPSLSRSASTASMTGRVSWSHRPGPQPATPGSTRTHPCTRAHPCTPSSGGSISGMLAGASSSSSTRSSSSGSSGYVSPFGPVEAPHYANSLPRKTGGPTHHAGPVKVQPPFLNPMIEILVAAKDCAEYNFEVKLFAPRSKELKKVPRVHLPALADLPYYVPPPVTAVMTISFGSSGKPVYGVKTSSGVSAACLPAYFEAVDAFRQRLENEIGHKGGQGGGQGYNPGTGGSGGQGYNPGSRTPAPGTGGRAGGFLGGLLGGGGSAEEKALKAAGCMCTSPQLELNTTDTSLKQKTAELFGNYEYKGLEGGRPYYQRAAKPHGFGVRDTITRVISSAPVPSSPVYLFWLPTEKQWMVGPTLGNKNGGVYSSVENSLAVCPGDPQAAGNWQRKSSFFGRWKKEATISMTCEK